MLGTMVSNMMIKPGSAPVFDTPSSFGLSFEDVAFQAADGVTLRGWLIPGRPDKVIIQSHFGVQCSRPGYTPKGKGMIKLWKSDISFLRQAKFLNDRGYTVLMYDLRNHGDSDTGSCPWISWGPEEAKDVDAAVQYIASHPTYERAGIGLLSICMGAGASTYAFGMGEEGLRAQSNLKAMFVVQPLEYTYFVKAFGLPGFLDRAGNRVSQERLGFDLHDKSFIDDVKAINVPTLVMQNRNDPWTDFDFVQRYYDELQVEKELCWVDLSKDRAAAYEHLGAAPEKLAEFFGRYV